MAKIEAADPPGVVGFSCTAMCHYPRQNDWHTWEQNYQAALDTVLQQNALGFFLEAPHLEGTTFSCLLHKPSHAVHLATRIQVLAKHATVLVGIGRGTAYTDERRKAFAASQSAAVRARQAMENTISSRPRSEAIFHGFERWDALAGHALSLTLSVRASWTGRQHYVVKLFEPIGSVLEGVIPTGNRRRIVSSVYRRSHHAHVQALELELGTLLDTFHAGHAIV
jgi:hypothetical protein